MWGLLNIPDVRPAASVCVTFDIGWQEVKGRGSESLCWPHISNFLLIFPARNVRHCHCQRVHQILIPLSPLERAWHYKVKLVPQTRAISAAGTSQSVRVKWSLADTCSMQQVSTAGSLHASSLSNIMTRISQSVLSLTKERTDCHALYSNVFVWHHQMSDNRMKDEWQTDTIIIIQEISNIKPIKPQTNCTPDYILSWLCKETRRISASGMLL